MPAEQLPTASAYTAAANAIYQATEGTEAILWMLQAIFGKDGGNDTRALTLDLSDVGVLYSYIAGCDDSIGVLQKHVAATRQQLEYLNLSRLDQAVAARNASWAK